MTSRHVEDPATSAPELRPEAPWRWRIERTGRMRVPGLVYATAPLLPPPGDQSLRQVADVATLPGVVGASFAMPDVHWGYGFPIGGVAATDVADGGVVSPGGVGFDISCGVRLLVSDVDLDRARAHLPELLDVLGATVHRGVGRGGSWRQDVLGLRAVLLEGAADAVARGWGEQRDLDRCEDLGRLPGAALTAVSERAVQRGLGQLGSLGAGNHFLEVQVVDRVLDQDAAAAYGLREGQVCVMIHCGSRGLGHQVCSDHVRAMERCMPRYGISVPDPQLACAPVDSPEGQAYLGAMAAAANFARANRHVLGVVARRAVEQTLHGRLDLLYDVSHNLAKLELHDVAVDGRARPTLLCVHRKGATRAFGPGHPDLPEELRATGQPVLVPGSMGTASWVLVGTAQGPAFASACHGAGRCMSRHAALRRTGGREVAAGLADAGVLVRGTSWRGLAEEAPFAYKDVDAVVEACELAGLARRVARLRPVGVVKG